MDRLTDERLALRAEFQETHGMGVHVREGDYGFMLEGKLSALRQENEKQAQRLRVQQDLIDKYQLAPVVELLLKEQEKTLAELKAENAALMLKVESQAAEIANLKEAGREIVSAIMTNRDFDRVIYVDDEEEKRWREIFK